MSTAPLLRVRLFGQPQFQVGETQVAFRGPARALSLFAYLLLHREQVHARPALAFILWPDLRGVGRTGESARVSPSCTRRAYRMSARYRGSLPTAAPALEPRSAGLARRCGVRTLSSGARDGRTSNRVVSRRPRERVDDEWLAAPRGRLRDLQTGLLAGLVASMRSQADLPRAAGYAELLLRHDPWREDAVRSLMELRYEMGDRAGALHVYREFADRLQKEMDVEPMPETSRIFERVRLANENPPRARTPAKHNLPPTLTSFVGREDALRTIAALVTERRLVTLVGTGGVGKTRLALESGRNVHGPVFGRGMARRARSVRRSGTDCFRHRGRSRPSECNARVSPCRIRGQARAAGTRQLRAPHRRGCDDCRAVATRARQRAYSRD